MEKDLQTFGKDQRMTDCSQRVSECRSSGLTVWKWCEQHGINEKTYYYWQRRIWKSMKGTQDSRFVQIPVKPAIEETVAARIRIGETEEKIYSGADAALAEVICRSLRPC